MAIFKLSWQVIENTLRTERHKVIVDLRDIAQQIATLKSRLIALDRERSEIVEKLASLERDLVAEEAVVTNPQRDTKLVTMASSTADKIALFRSLFRGREDVLPRRWENVKTGKTGYAPMCRNEWAQGICRKPLVKCGECKNQAFIPLSEDILHSHLAGRASGAAADFTIGIYPMLPDDTCWFLAADFDKKSSDSGHHRISRHGTCQEYSHCY